MSSAKDYEKFLVQINKNLDVKAGEQVFIYYVLMQTQSLQQLLHTKLNKIPFI